MSDSSDVDEDAGIVPTLQVILEGLKAAQERVKKLIATEKRVRRDDEEVATTLRKVRRTLETVQVDLVEVAAAPAPRKAPRELAKAAKKKRPRADDEKDDDREEGEGADERALLPEEDELGDEDLSDEQNKRAALDAPLKAKTIGDGMAGRIGGRGVLVYFALLNEKEGKNCICLSRGGDRLRVVRKTLVHVKYENLPEDERTWYLVQFEADVLRRFQINFPVLFANSGRDMINARQELLQDPSKAAGLIDSLARQAGEVQAAAKTSPLLSAANNTALMLAASLHHTLSTTNRMGELAALLNDMCQRCDLKLSTMDRYRDVGNSMLRCKVFAFLLPSFIALHKEAAVALLEDQSALRRLESAFDDRFGVVEVRRVQEPMLEANLRRS